jgi:hypothetical protein
VFIAHLLGGGSGGQPPNEQPGEGAEEHLSLIWGEHPPDRVARVLARGRHLARGETAFCRRSSEICY